MNGIDESRGMKPLLSVVIPVHNIKLYLERCVASLAAQTIADRMEVIMVENGSSDGSLAECRRLAGIYPFIKVVVNDVLGPSAARNLGVEHACGEMVGFVDGDDYVDAEMFGTLVSAAKNAGADSAYCNYMLEYEDGSVKHPFGDSGKTCRRETGDVVFDIITEKSTSSPCVRIYPREFLATRKFPVGEFYEDHSTIYRWMADMDGIVHVDAPFYHYCIRTGSTTQTTVGGTSKTKDYFYADVNRIPFVKNYHGFSKEQRCKALERVVRCTLAHVKGFIMAMENDDAGDAALLAMRERLLGEALDIPLGIVGFGTWIRLRRMRWGWSGFVRKYRKRACRPARS